MDQALEAAFAAGEAIMAVYERPVAAGALNVEWKEDRSPLTEADKAAHAAIVSALTPAGLPVLSEEGRGVDPAERQRWSQYWLVDPLDGTKEFIKHNGEFTVNIALIGRDALPVGPLGAGTPMAGVLYAPVKDLLYFAWEGGGAYRLQAARTFRGRPAYELVAHAQRLPVPMAERPFTIVASRSHASPETQAFIARRRQDRGEVKLASMGSALKICLVAEGAADVYPRFAPTMEWDTAAGHAIALEAGKDLMDVSTGARMRYNKHELVNQWFIVQ